ncbi:hypothetical protein AVL63_04545 [Nesterenkonia jeotgali]|uniref:Uncharacterized protein n=1 Tax=Nesterenkonia jeotgali TaxID=317018 RepID=A0A0W8ICW0_9MICC|nr:hypothetical protein AVL63_04545 [Nesterenkonia jeotgali]
MTTTLCEEPTLPADFPLPKPVSIRAAVIGRDGSICRLCGDRVQSEGLSLVNVRPGMQAGELAELQIVLGCEECAAAADVAVHGRSSAVNRRTMRLLAFLYLENCQIAQTLPLRAVKS